MSTHRTTSTLRRRALAERWRAEAAHAERLAASYRADGDSSYAEELELVAGDYIEAAERLEYWLDPSAAAVPA